MKRKIAIIGLAGTTHHQAPWYVPEWEKWCLAWDKQAEDVQRYFDPHERHLWGTGKSIAKSQAEYVDHLNMLPSPVWLMHRHDDVPDAVVYPKADVTKTLNLKALGCSEDRFYAESSLAIMAALALHEAVTQGDVAAVGIWGIDMHGDDEYAYQRPNFEYLIGRLHGAGVRTFIPPESSLLRSAWGLGYYGGSAVLDARAA